MTVSVKAAREVVGRTGETGRKVARMVAWRVAMGAVRGVAKEAFGEASWRAAKKKIEIAVWKAAWKELVKVAWGAAGEVVRKIARRADEWAVSEEAR